MCVKTNWEEFSRKIKKFREKDEISRMFVMCVQTNWEEFSRKKNKIREKDEISRMFVCECLDE